jgi:hypothetical protein
VLLVLALSSFAYALAGAPDPAPLRAVLDDPRPETAPLVLATGTEILALDAGDRTAVERWLRRGGRLQLVGDASLPALRLLAPEGSPAEPASVWAGLGRITVVGDAPADRSSESPSKLDGLLVPAAELARAGLPDAGPARAAAAARLAIYVLLLLAGLLVSRRLPTAWRRAGTLSLVLLFSSWPLWSGRTTASADRWFRVDVVVWRTRTRTRREPWSSRRRVRDSSSKRRSGPFTVSGGSPTSPFPVTFVSRWSSGTDG